MIPLNFMFRYALGLGNWVNKIKIAYFVDFALFFDPLDDMSRYGTIGYGKVRWKIRQNAESPLPTPHNVWLFTLFTFPFILIKG